MLYVARRLIWTAWIEDRLVDDELHIARESIQVAVGKQNSLLQPATTRAHARTRKRAKISQQNMYDRNLDFSRPFPLLF
jgi:hypothetical protein